MGRVETMRTLAVLGALCLMFVSLAAFVLSDFGFMGPSSRTSESDQLAGFAGAAMAGAAVLVLAAATEYSVRLLVVVWVALSVLFVPAALRLSFGTVLPNANDLAERCEVRYEDDEELVRVAMAQGVDEMWAVLGTCRFASEQDALSYFGTFEEDVSAMVTGYAAEDAARDPQDT